MTRERAHALQPKLSKMRVTVSAPVAGLSVHRDGIVLGPSDWGSAVAVDPEAKTRNLKRLRRIEGQVRGLQKMVEEDRYCADVLTQIASVHEALRSVGKELMRNHLRHCAAGAIRAGAGEAEEDEAGTKAVAAGAEAL